MASHSPLRKRFIAALTVAGALVATQPLHAQPAPLPAEEARLSTAVFRAGLKKRGLTALLEQHVKDFPPASETEASLLLREIKLAESVDPTRSAESRQAAVQEANRILCQVIADRVADPRRFEWQFELAHSLLHDEAEPLLNVLLYQSGEPHDPQRLLALTSRAVAALKKMTAALAGEYERIERLSIRQFEKLEAEGYLARLDALGSRAEYLLLWALLYDSLPRTDSDPVRAAQLHEILERMEGSPALIRTAHDTSGVEVQALLLAGMTHRMLNQHRLARQHLDRALAVVEGIEEQKERNRIDWAVTLTWLEIVRNEADDGRFDDALDRLERFRRVIADDRANAFGKRLIEALARRSVLRARADRALLAGNEDNARRYRQSAWRAVAELAGESRDHRDEVYAAIYRMIDKSAAPESLDPLEQSALVAGLLSEADGSDHADRDQLARAIAMGDAFLRDQAAQAGSLVPVVLYNIGVAEFRRGRLAASAERFMEVARDHATFEDAPTAAMFAVQLASKLYTDPQLASHPEVGRLYRDALELLLSRYADSDATRYWRFYYAQLLDELGEFSAAAWEYAQVEAGHENHLESLFSRVRCLALALQDPRPTLEGPAQVDHGDTEEFFRAQREFAVRCTNALGDASNPGRIRTLKSWMAEATVLAAEVQILSDADRAIQALETLADFETTHPEAGNLAARVWRVRLLAYERLDRLDDAASAIPQYLAADPKGAGATLQNLYVELVRDVERLEGNGVTGESSKRAELALVLARAIESWSAGPGAPASSDDRQMLRVQLAEANLRAGHFERALALFESLSAGAAPQPASKPRLDDARIVVGHAEAMYRLGDYAGALREFNRLAMGLPPGDPQRWQALLRDLQCRTHLEHPPEGIIRVIEQQKRLYPELGGTTMAEEFEKLLRSNERRRDRDSGD